MTLVLAVDPGLTGAYALLDMRADSLTVADLPSVVVQHGRAAKVRTELDLHTLREECWSGHISHCFMERVSARPGQGTISMFRFGECSGRLYGLIVGLNLPVTFVTPKAWRKHHGIGPSPDAARQRSMQLWPKIAHILKKDHHRADAALLAAYGAQHLQPREAAWLSQEAFLKPISRVTDAGHGWVIELARLLRSEVGAMDRRGSMARRAGCIATRAGGPGA
jgi:crossover junction endodeoxyribonuclease RuvC